jgi:hypothetical protein
MSTAVEIPTRTRRPTRTLRAAAAVCAACALAAIPANAAVSVRFIGKDGTISFTDGGRTPEAFCADGFKALDSALAVFQLENCKGDFYSLPADLQTEYVLLIDDRKGSPALKEETIRQLMVARSATLPGPLLVRWRLDRSGPPSPVLIVAESQRQGLSDEKWQSLVTLAATSTPFDAPFVAYFQPAPAPPKDIPLSAPQKDRTGVYFSEGPHPIAMHRGFLRSVDGSKLGQRYQAVVAARSRFVTTSLEQVQGLLAATGSAGEPGLKQLNARHSDLLKDLRSWKEKNRDLRKAKARLVAANRSVRAARNAVDAALADLKILTSQENLEAAQAERAAVAKRISERGALIKGVAGFVESSVLPNVGNASKIAGAAKDVLQGKVISGFVDAIVGLFNEDDLRQLAEIDARISDIEKTIKAENKEKVTKTLESKRETLEAATSKWLAALIAVRLANSPKEALADLANAEKKAAGSGARFSTAAFFFDETSKAGTALATSCAAFRSELSAGPVSQALYWEKDIDEYIERAKRDGIGESEAPNWFRSAKEWSSFLSKLKYWRERQLKACASIEDYLEMAGYLAPVDAVVRNAYCSLEAGSSCSWKPADLEWLRQTQVASD